MSDIFCASDWISCGRIFSDLSITPAVEDEMKCLLAVPPSQLFHASVPYKLTVKQLLDKDLPPLDTCLQTSFSLQPPASKLPDNFSNWTIPTSHNVHRLLDQFGQAWFDGHLSIIHPSFPCVALPVWVLSYWSIMSALIEGQQDWHAAHAWVLTRLNGAVSSSELSCVDEVLDILSNLSWDSPMKGFGGQSGLQTRELTMLLCDGPVSGRIVDGMVAAISSQMKGRCSILVEPLTLATMLQLNDMRWSHYNTDRAFSRLRYIGHQLYIGDLQHLYFPVNISNVHWAVFHIDGIKQIISYADSLDWQMPSALVDSIHRWLRQHGLPPFSKSLDFPHGEQLDSYSCAIAAINTIRHAILVTPLFTNETKFLLRMQEFICLALSHLDHSVSRL